MKKILLILILLSTAFAGKAQNLVPNGDFEQHTGCPTNMMQLDSSLFWMNPATFPPGGSPDYFHQCGNFIAGVPSNLPGYQWANSGAAYGGISLWSSAFPDFREYLEAPLTSTLIANQCYRFEMYVSLSNNSKYASDDIAVFFSNTVISGIANSLPLPFTPQINFSLGLTTDTLNWIPLTINYTATGGENFLIIGNFKNDSNSTSLLFNNNANIFHSYFVIDDVSLTPCTGIEEQNNNDAITIYPNPVKDELYIQYTKFKVGDQIKIYDMMGKEIYRTTSLTSDFRLPTSAFQKGIYFIEINNGKEVFRKKFLKG